MTTYQSNPISNITWQPIQKPAELAETRLIKAILDGSFPINSHLPGERELSDALGVTRPTLREALQRIARDGWVEIHQGKPTRIKDYWKEGKLGVLNALSEHPDRLPADFIPDLLNVRLAMAPMYTALAVDINPENVIKLLEGRHDLDDSAEKFTQFDWNLQHNLTILGENPVFVMILNGFQDLFLNLAPYYFKLHNARQHSMDYYEDLATAARENNSQLAKSLTENIMRGSLDFWGQTQFLQS